MVLRPATGEIIIPCLDSKLLLFWREVKHSTHSTTTSKSNLFRYFIEIHLACGEVVVYLHIYRVWVDVANLDLCLLQYELK